MSTEDAPFSRTQATWAHAGEDCENYKTVIVLLFFKYFVIFSCLLKILSHQE